MSLSLSSVWNGSG